MSIQNTTKILKKENDITYEAVLKYGDLIRDLPCNFINQGGLIGCLVRKKNLHQDVGDGTSIDIYALNLQYEVISPFEFQKSGKSWKLGDFFFPYPPCVHMVYQSTRVGETGVTIELSLHSLDTRSYGVMRFRNRTILHRDALIKRVHLDGKTQIIFR